MHTMMEMTTVTAMKGTVTHTMMRVVVTTGDGVGSVKGNKRAEQVVGENCYEEIMAYTHELP